MRPAAPPFVGVAMRAHARWGRTLAAALGILVACTPPRERIGPGTGADPDAEASDGAAPLASSGPVPDASSVGTDANASSGDAVDALEGSGTTSGPTTEPVYPEPTWRTESPEAHDFDPATLAMATEVAAAHDSGCLVVTRHGVIVHEWYAADWDASTTTPVFSVTKSITSALVGIAEAEGLLHRNDLVAQRIEPWLGTGAALVTIGNLLRMDSGRHWDFVADYAQLDVTESDKTAFAIARPQQHSPGAWWEYNNAAVQVLEAVLTDATGMDVARWAETMLFAPIGMDASFSHDEAGNAIVYAHLQASCRSLARFGYLYLRDGVWADGEVIVPGAWVEASTTPSTPHNDAYGLLWWLNNDGHVIRPSTPTRREGDGPLVPEAPLGMFTARGLGAQVVAVDPQSEIVFVRLAAVPLQDLFVSTDVEHELWGVIEAARTD